MTTLAARAGSRSSIPVKQRPIAGVTPSVEHRLAVTRAPASRSGSPDPVRLKLPTGRVIATSVNTVWRARQS